MPANATYLPLRPAAPLPGSGWTVRVYAHTDALAYAAGLNPIPMATISRFANLSWSPEIGEEGAGSVSVALADKIWSYPLHDGRPPSAIRAYDNLFVVYEDGQWRGEFFGRKLREDRVSTSGAAARVVTISGPGAAMILETAKVFSPYYPKTTPKNKIGVYQYKNLPVMASWMQLLAAAQRRGAATPVVCRFTPTRDSGGKVWEDTPASKPRNWDRATLAGDVLFPFDSYELTAAGRAAVTAIGKKLATVAYPIVSITGHTDSSGSRAYNQQLSIDRASAVATALLTAHPMARVTTYGRGETQPVASNRTAAGRRRNRRVVVTYQKNAAWTDTLYTPERGVDLLSLLKSMTSGQTTAEQRGPIHCEWIMRPRFRLEVRGMIGVDRSGTAVYHEGSSYLVSEGGDFDRSQIANVIAVQNDESVYRVAADATSIARWGRRELYVRLEGAYSDAIHTQIANTTKQAYADQSYEVTIAVAAGPGRTPFRDFGLGDYVGLVRRHGAAPSTVEKQRVVAITVTVDDTNNASYELKLSSVRAGRVKWLQTQVDALTRSRTRGVRAVVQDTQPTGGMPGDFWTPTVSALTD